MKSNLYKRIIPCLDVDEGRVVKGINFVGIQDAGDPVEVAQRYNAEGADEITFLDIGASHLGRKTTVEMIKKVAKQVFIPLTVGGGIRTLEDIDTLLFSGADKVSINSAAISDPLLVKNAVERFGSQCIVVALDAKAIDGNNNAWELYTHGGRRATGVDAVEWAIHMQELGAGEILLTSIDRDGTQQGYNISLTRAISSIVSIPVIASGGVGNLEHLYTGFHEGGADAVLAASIFHYQKYSIMQAKQYLSDRNISMRLC